MKKITNFFKAIWKFFFGQKVSQREPWMTDEIISIAKRQINEYAENEKKIISSVKMNGKTMLFRKQQLPGKVYHSSNGEHRYRIIQRIGETADRLKYQIEQL